MKRAPILALTLVALLGAAWAVSGRGPAIAEYSHVQLVKVVDGDTLRLDIQIAPGVWERNRRCRLVDVDVPELSTPEGKQAAARVDVFLQGKKLRLRVYGVDHYGRWLVRVDADGADLSTWLLEQKLGVARK